MKSIDEMFRAIMSVPWVDTDLKVRAGYLRTKLCGEGHGYFLFNLFGNGSGFF